MGFVIGFIIYGSEKGAYPEKNGDYSPDTLLVGTFNLRLYNPGSKRNPWDKRKQSAEQIIRDISPDIIGFQEVYTHSHTEERDTVQLDWLRNQFPSYSVIVQDETLYWAASEPILFRSERFTSIDSGVFTFSETGMLDNAEPENNLEYRGMFTSYYGNWVILYDKQSLKRFFILNVHVPRTSGDRKKDAFRLILDSIKNRIHAEDNVILLGDFNTFGTSGLFKDFRNSGLKNTAGSIYPASFHGFTGLSVIPRVDHIFVTSKASVLDTFTSKDKVEVYPSDHFPIFSRIKF
jgi:endonuclease/exonuclease/phosphatase family metal-dependent hydrolase